MGKSVQRLAVCAGTIMLLVAPVLMSGKSHTAQSFTAPADKNTIAAPVVTNSIAFADQVYDSLNLDESGLSEQAFEYAWFGYQSMLAKGMLAKKEILSICDFSQSSKNKRMYIIDLGTMKLLLHTYVAHGKNSGGEYANSFSNKPESHKSSIGFYVTRSTYFGNHGLSLKIDGIEKGFNDKALARNIVIHGSEYVGPSFLKNNPFSGRSYGCPAVPDEVSDEVINFIKDGSCLFIYYPSKTYIAKSRLLNA